MLRRPPLVAVSLVEIIANDLRFYEGDLGHYFRAVCFNAQNLRLPYHNFRHSFHVLWLCYQACFFYRHDCSCNAEKLTPRGMRNLFIAALSHDYDHSGMRGHDDLNITRAIRALETFCLPEDIVHFNDISMLMKATESPHVELEEPYKSDLRVAIIRDADRCQVLDNAWIQQVIIGLGAEWGESFLSMLERQEGFLADLNFDTEWANLVFPREVVLKRLEEVRRLVRILKGGEVERGSVGASTNR